MLIKCNRRSFLFPVIFFAIFGCTRADSTEFSPQVVFRGQTEAEAFDYVMELIKASPYYKKYGYKHAIRTGSCSERFFRAYCRSESHNIFH